ncbi:hypothetical protein NDI85_21315 [Halomicroarcula sp. S1AR25-4]|uniref:hypothetical protein n=1 Tax=Haloarcula sp. S1AR25-4 TaxID=2950538 RepID=UPI00287593B3|nr:hypothetical protein [Halomicroarcula sp. S1AR25-4]MDS0280328.1 hypothetical protein [Halomicroarcula sp. S1AR25-4]
MADGSAVADAHDEVVIDREDEPYRWRCPNGHTTWDRTNSHLWCPSCRRAMEQQGQWSIMHVQSAEHWEIVDEKTGETIPYSAVRFAEDQ